MTQNSSTLAQGYQFVHGKLAVDGAPPQDIIAATDPLPPEIRQVGLSFKRAGNLRINGTSRIAALAGNYAVFVCYLGVVDEAGRQNIPGHFIVMERAELAKFQNTLALLLLGNWIPLPGSYTALTRLPPYTYTVDQAKLTPEYRRKTLGDVIALMPSPEFFFACLKAIVRGDKPLAMTGFDNLQPIPQICLGLSFALPIQARPYVSFTTYSGKNWALFGQSEDTVNVRFVIEDDAQYRDSYIASFERKTVHDLPDIADSYIDMLSDMFKYEGVSKMVDFIAELDATASDNRIAGAGRVARWLLEQWQITRRKAPPISLEKPLVSDETLPHGPPPVETGARPIPPATTSVEDTSAPASALAEPPLQIRQPLKDEERPQPIALHPHQGSRPTGTSGLGVPEESDTGADQADAATASFPENSKQRLLSRENEQERNSREQRFIMTVKNGWARALAQHTPDQIPPQVAEALAKSMLDLLSRIGTKGIFADSVSGLPYYLQLLPQIFRRMGRSRAQELLGQFSLIVARPNDHPQVLNDLFQLCAKQISENKSEDILNQ